MARRTVEEEAADLRTQARAFLQGVTLECLRGSTALSPDWQRHTPNRATPTSRVVHPFLQSLERMPLRCLEKQRR